MKLIDKTTGKEVDMVEEGIYIQSDKIYAVVGEYDKYDELASEDVTDKYEISTGVRSREEIEAKIAELEKDIYCSSISNFTLKAGEIKGLKWVLEGDK